MIDSFYKIEGITTRITSVKIKEDVGMVRVYTTRRPFDFKFEDMPSILQDWLPENYDNHLSYDHVFAEINGIKSVTKPVTPSKTDSLQTDIAVTKEEVLKSKFLDFMVDHVADGDTIMDKINLVISNLKDPKNSNNQHYTQQAKQIINALNTGIKLKKVSLEIFQEAKKLFMEENLKPPKTDGEDNKQ
jgi:hypothetical protein